MSGLPSEIVDTVRRLIVHSPYGRLIGAELVDASEGRVTVKLPYREEVTTLGDTVHGGAIAALVDVAATACFWASTEVPPGARGTTIGFTVSFLSGARGRDVVARASVRRRGREISTGDVSVCDVDGREVAAALVTYKLGAPG